MVWKQMFLAENEAKCSPTLVDSFPKIRPNMEKSNNKYNSENEYKKECIKINTRRNV